MKDSLLDATLTDLASSIRRKNVSAYEVTEACLTRAREVQQKLNCFISIEEEAALQAAQALDRSIGKRSHRPRLLDGVPLAHKDMFYRAGQICTGGSKILRRYRPNVTGTVSKRLYAAGAIWLGNCNMAEFAANPTGHNDHWGHCRNPWNPKHITGGSSSGSGSAVSARACYGSLGSDTGGSVRIPAAANGVVGLKPTYGRVSRYGILPRAWSLDTVGPLSRSVRDCARLLQVIAGHDELDHTTSNSAVPDYEGALTGNVKGLKIGVVVDESSDADSDVRKRLQGSLEVFRSLGAKIIQLKLPERRALADLSALISMVEAAAIHGRWLRERPQDYSLIVRTRFQTGFYIPATSYLEALKARSRLAREFHRTVFRKVDVLHAPVLPMPVPTIKETTPASSGAVHKIVAPLVQHTRTANFLGIPALSIPAGFTPNGLPVAFQLMGPAFSEASLLSAGDAYQRVTDWHRRAPPL